jgi:type IV secretion system protein TrbI
MWWTRSASAPPTSSTPGTVTDHRPVPAGVMPRHLQQWLIIGVAIVMAGIMALSGPPTKPRTTTEPAGAGAVDPNQQRIEEYQRRIQEQAQRLAAEQAQLQLTKDAVAQGSSADQAGTASVVKDSGQPTRRATPINTTRDDLAPHVSDNVAFSRDHALVAASAPSVAAPPMPTLPPFVWPPATAPIAPSTSRPGAASAATTETTTSQATSAVPAAAVATAARTDAITASPADNEPRYRLFEGTVIDTVLTNRLDGTFNGPVNCLVSVPLYAADEQHLVIPAGARVLGEAKAVNTFGQSRLAVVFHRVILPNGTHIDLNGFHGLNQVGDLGVQDQVDRHYAQIFGVSLAIGAIAGFAQAQSRAGLDATGLDVYREGVAANVSQSAARILDRFLNLLPTVTIREGHRIKVYLANDLELPAYREPALATGGRP